LRGTNEETGGIKHADPTSGGNAVGGFEDNGGLGVLDVGERADDGQAGGGRRAQSGGAVRQ